MGFCMDKMDDIYLDILKEIGNIGAGNAATSLSTLINSKIDMEIPYIEVMETEKIVEVLGGEDILVIGVYVKFFGDINGTMLLILDKDSSDNFVRRLFNKMELEGEYYSELELSSIQEIGNILASSYICAISAFSNLMINITVPSISIDMAGSILSVPAIEYAQISDKIILIENKLKEGNQEMIGKFFLMPDIESFKLLFKSLGVLQDE